MDVFVKDQNGVLRETTLKELVGDSLKQAGLDINVGQLSDGSASWISVKKESAESSIIDTNLLFSKDGKSMISVKVYSTPIKTFVDEDNTKCLV